MTRSLIDLIFYGSIVISLPLAAYVLWLWSRKIWSGAKRDNNYSLSRIFVLMLPGIALMVVLMVPMFYAMSLQRADERCVSIFSAKQPDYLSKLPAADLKARRLKDMQEYCPKTDYDDLFSRVK